VTDDDKPIVLDDQDKGLLAHEALQEALNAMNRISDLEMTAHEGATVRLEGTAATLSGEALYARIDREREVVTHDLLSSIGLSLREAVELLDAILRHLDRPTTARQEAAAQEAAAVLATAKPCSITAGHEEHPWWDGLQRRWICPGHRQGRPIRDTPQG
jgi:predicted phage gp36 major capsid-like protein